MHPWSDLLSGGAAQAAKRPRSTLYRERTAPRPVTGAAKRWHKPRLAGTEEIEQSAPNHRSDESKELERHPNGTIRIREQQLPPLNRAKQRRVHKHENGKVRVARSGAPAHRAKLRRLHESEKRIEQELVHEAFVSAKMRRIQTTTAKRHAGISGMPFLRDGKPAEVSKSARHPHENPTRNGP